MAQTPKCVFGWGQEKFCEDGVVTAPHPTHWSLEPLVQAQSGPSHWNTESPTCGEGPEQIKGHNDSVQP